METTLRQEAVERIHVDTDITRIDTISEANKLISPYMEGYCNAEELWAKIHYLKAIVDEAEKLIKDRLVDDIASRYGKESAHVAGLEIRVKKGAGRWSYPSNSTIDNLKAKVKEVEELAKIASRSSEPVIYGDEVIPPAVYSENKDTLEVKVKK